MTDQPLRGCHVLVVEDEYMLADELNIELGDADAIVIGPAGTIEDALNLIRSEPVIDGAILDVNLRGDMIFPVADILAERGVPFLFTTGYDGSIIPARFADVIRCEKPVNIKRAIQTIGHVIHV